MKILAFDCAGAQCAAAILAQSEIVAAQRIEADRGHARLLMPMLADLLDRAKLTFSDMDRFAVTTGPGSFTGIRVALAAAQGLALGVGKPAIGITVFEALAASAAGAGFDAPRLLVAIESRRAECFVQMFDAQGQETTQARILTPEAVAAWAGPGRLALAGDAVSRLATYLADAMGKDRIDITAIRAVDPAAVAKLAESRIPGLPPAPFYLRDADAIKLCDR